MSDDNSNTEVVFRRPRLKAYNEPADVSNEVEQPQSQYKLPAWVQEDIDAVFRRSPDGESGVGPNDIPHTAQVLKESFRARGVRLGIEDIRKMLKQAWRRAAIRDGKAAGSWQTGPPESAMRRRNMPSIAGQGPEELPCRSG